MNEREWLAQRFEANRAHLHAIAYRMLGSLSDADDAVQEAWLRLGRADASAIENLGGWLTTVVSRLCLDMLRSRALRQESADEGRNASSKDALEQEAILADSVGLALLVVLDRLAPAERVAFVLHDLFDLPFEEIAPIVDRTPIATRQLASRARRRVKAEPAVPHSDFVRQREVVDAFLAAARSGDIDGLLAVLDPDIVLRSDPVAVPNASQREIRSAATIAKRAAKAGARAARAALVDGAVGLVIAPRGRLHLVLRFTIEGGRVVAMEAIGEPERLAALELALLPA
ncbi:MAG TPA: sigma-70 family RNA polymerase sigma factor [Nannocystaceae bacterium]|nr:sigma-70 family RNA polymerase sigma factor [Nannocystaceae bacterium]